MKKFATLVLLSAGTLFAGVEGKMNFKSLFNGKRTQAETKGLIDL